MVTLTSYLYRNLGGSERVYGIADPVGTTRVLNRYFCGVEGY